LNRSEGEVICILTFEDTWHGQNLCWVSSVLISEVGNYLEALKILGKEKSEQNHHHHHLLKRRKARNGRKGWKE
jgi:hypothetical protein